MNLPTENTYKTRPFNPFSGPKIEKVVYTTQSQAEIWLACKLGGDDANRAYNDSISLKFNGHLDRVALKFAIQQIVNRHESLRATFSSDGRFMSVLEEVHISLNYRDISNLTPSKKELEIENYLLGDANFVFDLINGPLLKIGLLKLNEGKHQLVFTAHHIICDGWSTGIMMEELGLLYSSKVSNENLEIPQPIPYSDYADEEQAFLISEEFRATEQFWLNQFKSSVPELNVPTDFPRPELRSYKSDRLDFSINNDLLSKLKKTGIKTGTSFVTTLMAAFELFLCKQTGQNDIVLGLPAAGQAVSGKSQLIGHCVNLLPLRSKITFSDTFNDYLKKRKTAMFDAYDNQRLSFGQLLQKLPIGRDASRVPLAPVIFNIDMGMASQVFFKDLSFKLTTNPRAYEAFEIFLNASGTEDNFILEWQYNASLFKSSTIEQMMETLEDIIEKIVENPESSIAELIKTDDTAYKKLNDTSVLYSKLPLHELLIKQAQLFPNNKAIKYIDSEISYATLEKQVNQLAHNLNEKGIKQGDFVGVCLPRSLELVITLLAIMQCGAAYLPLDPNYPSERLDFMIEDSETKFLITTETFSSNLETSASQLLIKELFSDLSNFSEQPLGIDINQNDVAYLLYTSGSTGRPKGVRVTHKNLVNFLSSMAEAPGIKETDRLLSITTISFDIAGLELFLPLLKGATLIVANDETARDGRLMLELIKEEDITMLQATPTSWQMLLDSGWENPLPIKALCGGESLPMVLAKNLLNKVDELWNVYGPTETTIWSAVKQIKKEDELITIGRPIANTQLYLLNEQDMLVNPGAVGELCIAGDGVSLGYWKRPDLTSEKFIPNPFDSAVNKVLYRTGDLGKLLPSGEVQCLGRIDHQVKIRGHRIELGEIEQALDRLEEVQSSVVMVNEDRLIAYLVLNGATSHQLSKWKQSLASQLPTHMVPQEFNVINEFPTTLNGKIDRKALKVKSIVTETSDVTVLPRTETEQIVADIWQKSLNIENIDINKNFFELGGHSLTAVKVMTKLDQKMGIRLPLSALMIHPTIQELAKLIDVDKNSDVWSSLVPLRSNGNKTPLYIVHGAGHNVLLFNTLKENLDENQPIFGLQAKGTNGVDKPLDKIEDMATHYIAEIQRKNPSGPYTLAGYSFGGVIAFEMARQLRAQGKEVTNIILLDSYVYPKYYCSGLLKKNVAQFAYVGGQILFGLKQMFSGPKHFKIRINAIRTGLRGIYSKFTRKHDPIDKLHLELNSKNNLAMNRYFITPQDVKVDLLMSEEDVYFKHDPKNLGWKKIALGGIIKHKIPGSHINMFEAPFDRQLGSTLQRILDNRNEKF